jgi:hypothetical protein
MARSLGGISGCFKLWRQPAFDAPPQEGVLFVRPYKLAGLSSVEEERDAILVLADEMGVRAGSLDTASKTREPLEALLRRERFRTYRRVVVLGYLPAPLKHRLRSFCGGTELVDFSDVSTPPLAGNDGKQRAARARWLRDVSSPEGVPMAPPRQGVLMIVGGANIKKAFLGRRGGEKVLDWLRRSSLRADFLSLKGRRVADLVMQAGGPSYKTILALGVMAPESKRELKSVVGDTHVADLDDLGCSPDVFRAVADASHLETASGAAPFLEALRKLASDVETPTPDHVWAESRSRVISD